MSHYKSTLTNLFSRALRLQSMDIAIPTPNIVLFGECGSGKSSIVNMIAQKDIAPAGSGPTDVTLKPTCYSVSFDDLTFNIYDTAGLDEASGGSVLKQQAISQLYRLLTSLTGINLLIFCVRAPRIREDTYRNWHIFHEIVCGGNVPIVLAITGLEQEDNMCQWWLANKGAFQKHGMHPNGVACITATRGYHNRLADEYRKSCERMRKQIKTCCLEQAWRVQPRELFKKITEVYYEMRRCGLAFPIEHKIFRTEAAAGLENLIVRCNLSEKEALEWSEALSKE